MLAIRGINSAIARALPLPRGEQKIEINRNEWPRLDADRYLFCQGLLFSKTSEDQSEEERSESYRVNALDVIASCEHVIKGNDRARICVIGSESAFSGSFDGTYAKAKVALHRYVETRQLRTPHQQLVCIAPSIIGDAGMTLRRTDTHNLERRRLSHPKKRFLSSLEVAKLVYHVLYVDDGYLTGVVIRMNGGAHTA